MLMNVSLQTALKCVTTLRVPTSVAVRKDSVYFLTIQHVKVDLHIKNKTFDLYVSLCWSFTQTLMSVSLLSTTVSRRVLISLALTRVTALSDLLFCQMAIAVKVYTY